MRLNSVKAKLKRVKPHFLSLFLGHEKTTIFRNIDIDGYLTDGDNPDTNVLD
jgi:hypothetical protein